MDSTAEGGVHWREQQSVRILFLPDWKQLLLCEPAPAGDEGATGTECLPLLMVPQRGPWQRQAEEQEEEDEEEEGVLHQGACGC